MWELMGPPITRSNGYLSTQAIQKHAATKSLCLYSDTGLDMEGIHPLHGNDKIITDESE
jgi:hypothetical protein